MKNKLLILILCVALNFKFINIKAQTNQSVNLTCGTAMPDIQWETEFAQLIEKTKQSSSANKQQAIFTIPVIIHVIHGGQAIGTYPNLAAGQLISQIQTLNNDFGGIGFNSSIYPLNAFSNYAVNQNIPSTNLDLLNRIKIANCGIEFCLATKDTLGNTLAEPGIDRINYIQKGWSNPATITGVTAFQNFINGTVKPQTVWNVSKYLNIWITDENIASNNLLGYATFPVLSNLTGFTNLSQFLGTNITDGYWCYARAFGSALLFPTGTYYQNYTLGRTSTHEIGHWLGLRHIWGDANCGTDYCDDTPPARTSNFNSIFSYPYKVGTCSGNSPNGEMYMNFMDYPNDNAKYMYTTDQATRMQTAMLNSPYRKFLGTHNLCSVAQIAADAKFATNPTVCAGAALTLSNQSVGTPIPTYSWTSSAGAFLPNNATAYTITFPTPGIYSITLTAFNGSLSSMTKSVTVLPAPSVTLTPNRTNFCLDESVLLELDGGVSYYWRPDSVFTPYVVLETGQPASFSYTCIVTGTNGCKTNTVINANVINCTSLEHLIQNSYEIKIYPNPASNFLSLESTTLLEEGDLIEILSPIGQLVKQIKIKQPQNDLSIDLNEINQGYYIIRVVHHLQIIKTQGLIIK